MYKNILVPLGLDDDRDRTSAISVAQRLCDPSGKITLIHVLESLPAYINTYIPEGTSEKNEAEALANLKTLSEAAGGTFEVKVVWGHPARTILDEAEEESVDCIVVASHRPGLQDYLLGSTASRIVHHAACGVHVVR